MTASGLHRVMGACRLCGEPLGAPAVAFDALPVAGVYVAPASSRSGPCLPLSVTVCGGCGHVQLLESLAPHFYERYSFVGSTSQRYLAHLEWVAEVVCERLGFTKPRVLEVGASDGALLDLLRRRGAEVGGFEPSASAAAAALTRGLPVANTFFGPDAARMTPLPAPYVIVFRHVLEHIDDFALIFEGIRSLCVPQTLLVLEVPDLVTTVRRRIHSNFYHPHTNYFDAAHLGALLARFGWVKVHEQIVDVFGGSLFVIAAPSGTAKIPPGLGEAAAARLAPGELDVFFGTWKSAMAATRSFFDSLRAEGGGVVDGHGAAERTVATIGMCGLDSSHIRRLYDRNPAFHGRAVPGAGIIICPPEAMDEDPPRTLVLFAQSFEEEIVADVERRGFRDLRLISMRTCPPHFIEREAAK
jgi:hypothetical protein